MKIYIYILIVFPFSISAQVAPHKYVVSFTNRTGTPYSTSNPAAYLSQRAIDRRTRQGISIITNDLPVNPAYIDSVKSKSVTILNHSKWLNCIVIATDTNANLEAMEMAKINALPFVKTTEYVERELQSMTPTAEPFKKTEITNFNFSKNF